jgi:hypothetical protein
MKRRRFYKPNQNLNRVRHIRTSSRRQRTQEAPESHVDTSVVRKILSTVFFIASVAWFVYFFLLSDNFFIKTIKIEGNENIPIEELNIITYKYLDNKNWYFFPNKNIILFSEEGLKEKINEQYIVENITIDKKYPYELKISIEEKLARLILRTKTLVEISDTQEEEGIEDAEEEIINEEELEEGDTEEEKIPEPTYTEDYFYLDVNGIIVSQGNILDKDITTLPTIEMEFDSQTLVKPGDTIMSRERVEYIYSVYETIGKSKEGLELIYVLYDSEIDDELTFATKEGWQGFLSTDIALETQIKKLELALQEKIKENRANLQYVDLRVKDRVYFK